jgi:hypothetical protein
MSDANCTGPVGPDDKAIEITDDQQRRIFERQGLLLELTEGRLQVLTLSFIFPSEMATLPNIGPAFTTARFCCAPFEAVEVPAGSACAGDGSPSSRHRSRKCSCAAERSFSSTACHFRMKSLTVNAPGTRAGTIELRVPRGGTDCSRSNCSSATSGRSSVATASRPRRSVG